ncbi:erythromycin esterase family protein [Rhodocytophaga rosea]|uniref:Erythromycin esterase family protein n=1 Tax=Rhodocytophaga rosea TaxID=2704465 RepID=A0A6C0GU42_9BACT|nr:erythromycin esterase family protein [Rhodocytophaga rosea]QHT70890.1 erythromycin esterase family protein [Rhodocytophaga rosea]
MSQTNIDNLILDLRAPVASTEVFRWLHSPHKVYLTGWFNSSPAACIQEVEVSRWYDGLIFIKQTTPTRPTANALKTVARREGL